VSSSQLWLSRRGVGKSDFFWWKMWTISLIDKNREACGTGDQLLDSTEIVRKEEYVIAVSQAGHT